MLVRKTPARVAVAAAVAAASVLLASCSGGAKAGSKSGGGEVPSEATALVSEHLSNPVSVGYDTPLSRPVPQGKRIVALQVAVDVAKVENDAMRKAAEVLGWDYETIVVGNGPEDPAKALAQAVDANPDGIYYSGYPTATMSEQLDRAQEKGIAVFAEALGTDTPDAVFTQIRNAPTVQRLGSLTAAWVVDDSKADANVLVVDTPAFPILTVYTEAVQAGIEDLCDSCRVDVMDANVTDIGTALPSQIVSELQRQPDIDYVVFSFGDLTVGLNAALAAAGLLDKVKIAGQLPGLQNLENLRKGEDAAWVPELSPLIGWRVIDAFAREFVGDDPAVAADGSQTPTQVLTPSNVNNAVFDPSGYWVGVADYESIFKKFWNVS